MRLYLKLALGGLCLADLTIQHLKRFYRSLKPPMTKVGLPAQNFQTLRRSNATFLVLLGVSPRVATRWIGHSDVATTLKHYQQAPDKLQEKVAELVEELLFGAQEGPENDV